MLKRLKSIRGLLILGSMPVLLAGAVLAPSGHEDPAQPTSVDTQEPSRLAVVWTSGDREVALNVAFMYTLNAKLRGWFDEVTLIVWGPSAELLTHDVELQQYVARMAEEGVDLVACKACADNYGVAETLEGLGVEVKYMGVPLSEMLQNDWRVLTF